MYNPLYMTNPTDILDWFELNKPERSFLEQCNTFYTEAVFSGGKKTIAPIVECFKEVKQELKKEVNEQKADKKDKNGKVIKGKKFNPEKFWKHKVWKDLEDAVTKVFGVRVCVIEPYIEKYKGEGEFQSKELNAYVYPINRFPIEALITDKGLYDESHSLIIDMKMSLGLIMALEPEELTGVMLHEIGHGIDPALVDIRFTETNILSKYITDRKGAINKDEQKVINQKKNLGMEIIGFIAFIALLWLPEIIAFFKRLFMGKEKYEEAEIQKRLEKIKYALEHEKGQFNRQAFTEAFADNFARMYGFGAPLMSGLEKINRHYDTKVKSFYKRETMRQEAITRITVDLIADEHRTDIHRIRNLLREYENDLNDPNIPKKVKKGIKEDKEELEKVLDQYLNHYDEFQNRVNQLIDSELQKKDENIKKKEEVKKDEKSVSDEAITESKKAYEKLMKAKKTLTSEERKQVKEKFGETKCSFAKDKDGYYCYTHRCRSKSYESIDDIPKDRVDFVSSTA